MIRPATTADLAQAAAIYGEILDQEEPRPPGQPWRRGLSMWARRAASSGAW